MRWLITNGRYRVRWFWSYADRFVVAVASDVSRQIILRDERLIKTAPENERAQSQSVHGSTRMIYLSILVLALSQFLMGATSTGNPREQRLGIPGSDAGRATGVPCQGDDERAQLPHDTGVAQAIVQAGHPGLITTVAYSPRGALFGTGSEDGTVKIWRARNGQLLRNVVVGGYSIHSLAFSPNGCMLAVGSGDHNIYVWNVDDGRQLKVLEPHAGAVTGLSFSSDGTLLASGSSGSGSDPFAAPVIIWEVSSWKKRAKHDCPAAVNDVAFIPSSNTIAISAGKRLVLWDFDSNHVGNDIEDHNFVVAAPSERRERLLVSGDGRLVVSSGESLIGGNEVYPATSVWSVSDGKLEEKSVVTFPRFQAIGIKADGNSVVALRRPTKHSSVVWDGIAICQMGFDCHIKTNKVLAEVETATLGPDGVSVAYTRGSQVGFSDLDGAKQDQTAPSPSVVVTALRFSNSGDLFAVGLRGGQISVWNKTVNRPIFNVRHSVNGEVSSVRSFYLPPFADALLSAGFNGGVLSWDLSNARPPELIVGPDQAASSSSLDVNNEIGAAPPPAPMALDVLVEGHPVQSSVRDYFYAMAISSTGQIARAGYRVGYYSDSGKKIGFASITNYISKTPGRRMMDGQRLQASATAVSFSPDGSILAIGFEDGGIDLWNTIQGQFVARPDGHTNRINALAFSPNGRLLASASSDKTVRVWSLNNAEPPRVLDHQAPVLCVTFSLDATGQLLASGSTDHKVSIWDVSSGQMIRPLEGHSAAVSALAFFPNRQILVSGGEDGTVRFWSTSDFKLLATLLPVEGGTNWLTTTSNGYFDGNEATWKQVVWQFNGNLFDVSPVEIGMRDYFEPKLLARLLAGEKLEPVRPLASLNRVQPEVRVLSVFEENDSAETVAVRVEVKNQHSTIQKDSKGRLLTGGVYDIRLFRDGQIVGNWPEVDAVEKTGPSLTEADRALWRKTHEVEINATDSATITFRHIKLPRRASVSKVTFTAYAFNRDRVKSLTSPPYEYTLSARKSPVTAPRAYLITMGVDANQSRNLDLDLAVSSAEEARALLRAKLAADGHEVVEIPLYSERDDLGRVKLKTARKANLEAILHLLAGKPVDAALRNEVDPKQELRAAGPDDSVILYVVSHGYADPRGNFYLMPYDTGANWGVTEDQLNRCHRAPVGAPDCDQPRDLLAHSISSSDLAAWWKGVDGGQMVIILDTCHSGAVPGREFRPGPLGDPGFGQLSYDKGMQILSASQSTQTEKGMVTAGQVRTILVDVLKSVASDHSQQTLEQWLQGTETALPSVAARLYPALGEDDIQLPLLLDFAKQTSNRGVMQQ